MDLIQQTQHLCYVHCNFCNTVLAVGIPWKRTIETVTVKCGHCSNLSYLSLTRPPPPPPPPLLHHTQHHLQADRTSCPSTFMQGHRVVSGHETCRKPPSSSSSSSSSSLSPTVTASTHPGAGQERTTVVKPPEKKHRLPSAYNQFMKEEIQRIKAAHPEIPHREAFSSAAKNWARYIPAASSSSVTVTTISTHTATHP